MSIGSVTTGGYSISGGAQYDVSDTVTMGYTLGTTGLTPADIAAIWNEVLDDGYSARELMRLMAAVLLGKNEGLERNGGTVTYRSVGDVKDRITGIVDGFGNRNDVDLDED